MEKVIAFTRDTIKKDDDMGKTNSDYCTENPDNSHVYGPLLCE